MTETPRPRPRPPLAGLRVIELRAIGPVPFVGWLLGKLGASVVRVVSPQDAARAPARTGLLELGKERVAADLKSAEGRAAMDALLAGADVLIEGFRPGVLERIGLAPAVLAERHPRLVVGRLSGWGTRGAFAARAGHDINYLALTGLLNAIGRRDAPVPPLNVVADFGGGAMHLLTGVLAKLVERSLTGVGGLVETSILAGTIGLTPYFFDRLDSGGWQLERESNVLDGAAPYYRVYPTRDDRFVAVGAIEPQFYAELLALLGLTGEIDASRQHDRDYWPTMAERFAARFATRDRDDWAALAERTDCCVSPVLDFLEAARHPHNVANGLYTDRPAPHPREVIGFGPI
jgi:alpha-methylacyl-CoA racemase